MNDYEREHLAFLRRFGAECAVLLKSDGAFPLDAPCALALYGSGARLTIKGGTGSGEVNARVSVTAEEGLEAAGFRITTKDWMDRYGEIRAEAKKRFIRRLKRAALRRFTLAILVSMGAVMPEPEYDLPLDGGGDAAVYVLSRISGEGSDREPVPGDILLTETEKRDILALNRKYEKFLLVLNTGGVIDLSPVTEVRNILLLSQLGSETGNILADILLGKSAPSGKLASTWFAWDDHPAVGDFGNLYDTNYKEGVYVGYRYFDSIGKAPLFPFGFGLGYTRFSLAAGEIAENGGRVTLRATVRNVGNRPGKETAQLYVSPPRGKLDKPFQSLASFNKTEELAPGGEQELALPFDMRDLAAYDAERAAWILEPGDYVLRLGASSRDTTPVGILRLDQEAVVKQVRNGLGQPGFDDWKPEARPGEEVGSLPVVPVSAASFRTENVDYAPLDLVDPRIEALTKDELCRMNIGAFRHTAIDSVIGNAGQSVAGAAGETMNELKEKGIPSLVMADGPAGLRLARRYTRDRKGVVHALGETLPESVMELMPAPVAFFMKHLSGNRIPKGKIFEQHCSAIPIGTALAQSWNLRLAEACGDLVGDEMERFGIHLWLAPALNIHRDIRCGRNYEYFSEDPLVSGLFAAAVTVGVQKHPGRGATIKHFVANNQETNRYGNSSHASERALREIYLRGFEIAVREGQPDAVMTSYNLINGVHTSEHRGLAEDILRTEFGFRGILMTDWIIGAHGAAKKRYPAPNPAKVAAAGGDLFMPGGPGNLRALKKGLAKGTVTRRQMEINATRVYRKALELAGNGEKG